MRHVRGDPAGEFADAALAEEGHRQGNEALVAFAPEIREGTLPHAIEGERAVEGGEGLQRNGAGQNQRHLIQAERAEQGQVRSARPQRRVDQGSGQKGKSQTAGRAEKQGGETGEESPAIGPHITRQRQGLAQALAVQPGLGQAVESVLCFGRITA